MLRTYLKRKLAGACRRYLNYYNDYSYKFDKNGELELIQRVAQLQPKTVFDVGANVGKWSQEAIRYFGTDCKVHAFEMVPATYDRLVSNLSGDNVRTCMAALGDHDGEIEFRDFKGRDRLNTTLLRRRVWEGGVEVSNHRAKCMRGDSYCAEMGIDFVDFLKIDVEGAEHFVLRGFEGMLKRKAIRVVQFEYGYANGDVYFLMRDFFEMFEAFGYSVAKIRRGPLNFTGYKRQYNNFESGPNYVAIRGDDRELENVLTT